MAINADEMAGMQHLEEFIKIYDEKLTKVVKSSLDESNEEVMHLVNISQDNWIKPEALREDAVSN